MYHFPLPAWWRPPHCFLRRADSYAREDDAAHALVAVFPTSHPTRSLLSIPATQPQTAFCWRRLHDDKKRECMQVNNCNSKVRTAKQFSGPHKNGLASFNTKLVSGTTSEVDGGKTTQMTLARWALSGIFPLKAAQARLRRAACVTWP